MNLVNRCFVIVCFAVSYTNAIANDSPAPVVQPKADHVLATQATADQMAPQSADAEHPANFQRNLHRDNAHKEPLPAAEAHGPAAVTPPKEASHPSSLIPQKRLTSQHFMGATVVREFIFSDDEDLDQDDLPDGWLRRKGMPFPRYVDAMIDRSPPGLDHHALRYRVNGGPAVYYSPLIRIDPHFNLAVTGKIQTAGLDQSAGVLSLSVLDARRERIARWLSPPVSGSRAWEQLVIGPLALPPEATFVVLGCHLVDGLQTDVRGDVWFTDLQVVRLPNLDWGKNPLACYLADDTPFELDISFSGLEPQLDYELDLTARDIDGHVIARTSRQILPPALPQQQVEANTPLIPQTKTITESWNLDRLDHGHYQIEATLKHDGVVVISKTRHVVRFNASERNTIAGEFGWSIQTPLAGGVLDVLAALVDQTATHWVKYPVWETVNNPEAMGDTTRFLEQIASQNVSVVGVFAEPPRELRALFADDWRGAAEVFSLPHDTWADSMQPALARYGSQIRRWQMGADNDLSFVDGLSTVVGFRIARSEIQTIGRGSQVGAAWSPDRKELARGIDFLISPASPDLPQRQSAESPEQWVVVRSHDMAGRTPAERAGRLARNVVQMRSQGIDTVLHGEPFHPQAGLFRADGSPGDLFLPWRTLATSLTGKDYAGSFILPHRSENAIFLDDNEACMVLWNTRETTERAYLGENVMMVDLWGRETIPPVDRLTGQHVLPASPSPIIIRKCSAALAKWRVETHFERGRCKSEYGMHEDALVGVNTFPQGASGTVELLLPHDWEAEPRSTTFQLRAKEPWRIPFRFLLPATASLGNHEAEIVFKIDADRHYEFRMPLVYRVGLDDITIEVIDRLLPDGRLEIEQRVSNQTAPEEVVDFRCSLFVPGERRQRMTIPRLGDGLDKKFYYLPDGARFDGQTLWLRLEQENGRRILNYRWKVDAKKSGTTPG